MMVKVLAILTLLVAGAGTYLLSQETCPTHSTTMARPLQLLSLALSVVVSLAAPKLSVPEYIKPCQVNSSKFSECVIDSLHHLKPYLAKGIPEIQLPSVEPFILDSLSLSLSGGEKGYKITLKNIHLYGVSGYTISKIKLGDQFEGKLLFPNIRIDADYTSSGTLLILPASGGGEFHATLGNVAATVKGVTSKSKRNGYDYLNLDKVDITLAIKDVKMRVDKVFNNNRVLAEATNLFLQENGHEVLNVMMPQLRVKIAAVVKKILNQILSHTPVQVMTAT